MDILEKENYHQELLENVFIRDVELSLLSYDSLDLGKSIKAISNEGASVIEEIINDDESSIDNLTRCASILKKINAIGDETKYYCLPDLGFENEDKNDAYYSAVQRYSKLLGKLEDRILNELNETNLIKHSELDEFESYLKKGYLEPALDSYLNNIEQVKEKDNQIDFGE